MANFVLFDYGTGAIMAVPTHDQRDFEFAKKYNLRLRVVIKPFDRELSEETMTEAYVEEGILVNSGPFNGLRNLEALERIAEYLESEGHGTQDRELQVERLEHFETEILGSPDPHHLLRPVRNAFLCLRKTFPWFCLWIWS